MSTPAVEVDPRLSFNWGIELDGLEIALCSNVNIPDVEVGVAEHNSGGSAHSTKTGGRLKFGDITIEKAMPADRSDKYAWNWLTQVRDPVTGRGQAANRYKKKLFIIHYGEGREIIDKWEVKGAFCKKVGYSKNDGSQEAERMMETITLSVDSYKRS